MLKDIINIDPEIMSGTPVFMGTRVPVKYLFDYLEDGETVDEFLQNFPTVKKWQIIKLLESAHDILLQYKNEKEKIAA